MLGQCNLGLLSLRSRRRWTLVMFSFGSASVQRSTAITICGLNYFRRVFIPFLRDAMFFLLLLGSTVNLSSPIIDSGGNNPGHVGVSRDLDKLGGHSRSIVVTFTIECYLCK